MKALLTLLLCCVCCAHVRSFKCYICDDTSKDTMCDFNAWQGRPETIELCPSGSVCLKEYRVECLPVVNGYGGRIGRERLTLGCAAKVRGRLENSCEWERLFGAKNIEQKNFRVIAPSLVTRRCLCSGDGCNDGRLPCDCGPSCRQMSGERCTVRVEGDDCSCRAQRENASDVLCGDVVPEPLSVEAVAHGRKAFRHGGVRSVVGAQSGRFVVGALLALRVM